MAEPFDAGGGRHIECGAQVGLGRGVLQSWSVLRLLDSLLHVPALLKVLVALLLILVVGRFCRHLMVAIGVATLVLALWSGHSGAAILQIGWERLASANNLMLMVVTVQVILLSSQMSQTGAADDLVKSVRARVSRHASMAVLPAVIGLLPMPGGALFSAPLVDSVDERGEVPADLKAQANHWFRHIWEYWWPLYPGVLLAVELSGLEIWQFMLLQMPLTLFAAAVGSWFLLRRMGGGDERPAKGTRAPKFFGLILPIIVVILCYAAIRVGHAVVSLRSGVPLPLNKYLPMVVGLFAAIGVLQLQRPLGWRKWRRILLSRRAVLMAIIVASVRVYGAFIEAELPSGVTLVEQTRQEMAGLGLPLLPILMILPFVSGLSTGLSIGFVGASFPIVMSLIGDEPSLGVHLSTVILAYGFGFVGMLLSPVHVCLIVTSEHFKTRLLHNVAGLAKPGAAMLVIVSCAYLLVRHVFG